MTLVGYFGYGSLVNRDTLRTPYVRAVRAELKGYRREWGLRSQSGTTPICGLTVHADPDCSVQGLLVIDHLANLDDVDRREHHYDRLEVRVDDLHLEEACQPMDLYVYRAKPAHRGAGGADRPILQSYLDAVLQGYLREFGDVGLRRFVAETTGWSATVLADRATPRYPRAVTLSPEERDLFDELIEQIVASA